MLKNKARKDTASVKLLSLLVVMGLLLGTLPMWVLAAETPAASVGQTEYATVAAAVENANGQPVKLLADSQESITVDKDLYLDLNGHTLAAVTVTAGTLYGMDSTTDDFDCSDGYGKILSISGSFAREYKTDITGAVRRYLAVKEEGTISFHRLYLGITHISLQPAKQGVGYKAVFSGDAMVKAQLDETQAFGYKLQLGSFIPVQRWKSAADFGVLKTVTLRVNDYDAENYGETVLHAWVQVKLSDGTVITSSEADATLRQIVEKLNASTQDYTASQLNAMANWINSSPVMKTWTVDMILGGMKQEATGEGGYTEW